ncbi:uncharacterized protein FYW61_000039 [Anableps anableps]
MSGMSSVQHLREFISERLTAAAEEIFSVFQRTIVQYEEEMGRQRRLLDITWSPEVHLERTELPYQFLRKEEEELPVDQRLWKPSPDQQDPEPPRIKEELQGLCLIRGEEQLVLKQDAGAAMVPSAYQQVPNSRGPVGSWSQDSESTRDPELKKRRSRTRSPAGFWSSQEDQPVLKQEPDDRPEDREPNSSPLVPVGVPAAEVPDQEGSWNKEELKPKKRRIRRKNSGARLGPSGFGPSAGLRPVSCDICGKAFRCNSEMRVHSRVHTGEKPFSCGVCQRAFSFKVNLSVHMRTHTGEKPYACKFCDKRFSDHSSLRKHTNVHTGERPYSCAVCGKRFGRSSHMWRHVRVHAAEPSST